MQVTSGSSADGLVHECPRIRECCYAESIRLFVRQTFHMNRSFRLSFLLCVFATLAACSSTDEEQRRIARLHADLQPGVSLAQAESLLKSQGASFSERTAQECDALVKEARVPTQLQPKGGACVFGKLPVSRSWYGGRSDIIVQLVFDAEGKLRDGSFEAIQSAF